MKSLIDVVETAAAHGGGFELVADDGQERFVSFDSILSRARAVAGALRALGVPPGERVALILPDTEEFLIAALGAVWAGCAMVPLYPPLHARLLEGFVTATAHALNTVDARALITNRTILRVVGGAQARARGLRHVLPFDAAAEGAPAVRLRSDPRDIALIQCTSGSTSSPKGVVLTHEQLLANVSRIAGPGGMDIRATDCGVSWLPLFHDMGLIGMVLTTLYACASLRTKGKTVVMSPVFFIKRPVEWLRALSRHGGTISVAPNFAYGLIAKKVTDEQLANLDLSRWRIAGCGAEPIRAETLRAFARRLEPTGFSERAFFPCYGMAEHTLAITFPPIGRGLRVDVVDGAALETEHRAVPVPPETPAAREVVSCGRSIPDHEVRVVDETGAPVAERVVGEIEARGSSVMTGYFRDEERSAEVLIDGWLRTGDLGYLAEGELFVCGRKKDLIIVRGKKLHPQDLEWAVDGVPGVRPGGVVAFGTRTFSGDEGVVIVVERKEGADAQSLEAAVRRRLREALGVEVERVIVTEAGGIPKTTSGKLQRARARALHESGAGFTSPTGSSALAAVVKSQLGFAGVWLEKLVGRR